MVSTTGKFRGTTLKQGNIAGVLASRPEPRVHNYERMSTSLIRWMQAYMFHGSSLPALASIVEGGFEGGAVASAASGYHEVRSVWVSNKR